MSHILHYRSSRAEIWQWYWQMWKRKFWWVHVLLAAFVSTAHAYETNNLTNARSYVLWFLFSLPAITFFMALWPQVMFKSKERTLQVGPEGWSTQIGKLSGKRPWAKVAAIQETPNAVVITSKSGNALIIPARAFSDTISKQQFVKDSLSWHSSRVI